MQVISKQIMGRLTKAFDRYDNAWQEIKAIENEIRTSMKAESGIYKSAKDPVTNRHFHIRVNAAAREVTSFRKGADKEIHIRIYYSAYRCTRSGESRGHSYAIRPDELAKFTLVEKTEA